MIADIMLQTLGLAAFIPALIFLVLGVRIFKRQSIGSLALRTASILLAALFGAVALVHAPARLEGVVFALDSAAGMLILDYVSPFFEDLPYAQFITRTACGFIAFVFFPKTFRTGKFIQFEFGFYFSTTGCFIVKNKTISIGRKHKR